MSHPNIDMDPQEIRVELLRKGITQAELARELGVSSSLVTRVIDGTSVSHRVRERIARAIQIDVRRIWPSTYIYKGGPGRPGRPSKRAA